MLALVAVSAYFPNFAGSLPGFVLQTFSPILELEISRVLAKLTKSLPEVLARAAARLSVCPVTTS
ncbi:hypothetical protein APHNP_0967 [Anaplasma phagocytophilum str. ApNP]|uniref:Uncharacterized protein n=1 Tax=Anaplasma phagocytophilum str. ApNP TaxID=1359153 RepID=A0A0F3NIK5_ANAPH|nr:hypothetical protein APHNP_0967 [Anaplasma phagocytophilum str. ApNP]